MNKNYPAKNFLCGALCASALIISAGTLPVTGAQIPYAELSRVQLAPANPECQLFGRAMTPVGIDSIAIGAPFGNAGSEDDGWVFIHNRAGAYLNGVGNPNSSPVDPRFGTAIARWGSRDFIVGAPGYDDGSTDEGIIYISSEGSVTTAYSNPSSSPENGRFGTSIVAIDDSFIIVGAPGADDRGGRVYILDNAGSLQTELANPSGNKNEDFGHCLALVSNQIIVVGSLTGEAVHMFTLEGGFIRTITSPSEAAVGFGSALTVIAGGRIVVGAPGNDALPALGEGSGKIHMFSHDGRPLGSSLVPRETPPVGAKDKFGISLGTFWQGQYFVVGAPFSDSREKEDTGSAHVFDQNCRLIKSIQNPNVDATEFGRYVAGLGTNQFGVTESRGLSGERGAETPTGLVHLYSMIVHEPDAYEPDDTPLRARHYPLGTTQRHTFHSPDDRDWVKFFVHPDFDFEILLEEIGQSSYPLAQVYRQKLNGQIEQVFCGANCKTSDPGFVVTPNATVAFTNAATGIYYVEVSNADTNAVGKNTEYELKVSTTDTSTLLAVIAVDLLSPMGASSPPGTEALVDDKLYAFNGDNIIVVPGLAPGPHTVTVFYPTNSYMPDHDPLLPDQQDNASNILFGNPRTVQVIGDTANFAPYAFLPFVKADAVVQDAFTGAWLEGATLSFESTSGPLSGSIVTQFPPWAVYGELWRTDANGSFPTNVFLPLGDWTLHIGGDTYTSNTLGEAVIGASAGETISMGPLTLDPVDTNNNGIADSYELQVFGGSIDPNADPDGDGLDTITEYQLGTDPTNAASRFGFDGSFTNGVSDAGVTLCWPVAPGRSYVLYVRPDLIDTNIVLTFGPWTAAVDQACMQWVDTAYTNTAERFYSIGAILP